MFWGKKEEKKKGLPELPPLKITPAPREEEREDIESHPLPSFPDSPTKKGFAQSAIKESMEAEDEEAPEPDELPALPPKFKMPKIHTVKKMTKETPFTSRTEDVFVKIDKFHSARKALNSAREKLREIDELVRRIRETKKREEQELASWEEEIASVKSKVEDVTNNIFEKVE